MPVMLGPRQSSATSGSLRQTVGTAYEAAEAIPRLFLDRAKIELVRRPLRPGARTTTAPETWPSPAWRKFHRPGAWRGFSAVPPGLAGRMVQFGRHPGGDVTPWSSIRRAAIDPGPHSRLDPEIRGSAGVRAKRPDRGNFFSRQPTVGTSMKRLAMLLLALVPAACGRPGAAGPGSSPTPTSEPNTVVGNEWPLLCRGGPGPARRPAVTVPPDAKTVPQARSTTRSAASRRFHIWAEDSQPPAGLAAAGCPAIMLHGDRPTRWLGRPATQADLQPRNWPDPLEARSAGPGFVTTIHGLFLVVLSRWAPAARGPRESGTRWTIRILSLANWRREIPYNTSAF